MLEKMPTSRASSGSGRKRGAIAAPGFTAREIFLICVVLWLAWLNAGQLFPTLDDVNDDEVTKHRLRNRYLGPRAALWAVGASAISIVGGVIPLELRWRGRPRQ